MGNTFSKHLLLESIYSVALSLSVLLTLINCLFDDVPRTHHVVLLVQGATPTITLGTTSSNLGTTGSFVFLYNAKLDTSGEFALLVDKNPSSGGPILCNAAPYSFLRRSTTTGASVCSFDGSGNPSSSSSSRIYCRANANDGTFLAYKFSDLSIIQESGTNKNPLVLDETAGGLVGRNGLFQVISGTSFAFITSELLNGRLYRVDISIFTYTGTVTSTKTATDTSNPSERYRWGACGDHTDHAFCYALSAAMKLAKFSQGSSSTDPSYVSTIDLDQAGQLSGAAVDDADLNAVIIDKVNNNLLVASTQSGMMVAKISLTTFTFSSKVSLSGAAGRLALCENCYTSGNEYFLVLATSGNSARDARFVEVSSMTELTDASSYADPSNPPFTAWLSLSANSGVLISDAEEAISLTTTGVATPAPPSTTTTTTTATPSPGNNNNQKQSVSTGVIVIASAGSIIGFGAIVVGIVLVYQYVIAKKDKSEEEEKDDDDALQKKKENVGGEDELQEVTASHQ